MGPKTGPDALEKSFRESNSRFLIPTHRAVTTDISYCISEIPHFDEVSFSV